MLPPAVQCTAFVCVLQEGFVYAPIMYLGLTKQSISLHCRTTERAGSAVNGGKLKKICAQKFLRQHDLIKKGAIEQHSRSMHIFLLGVLFQFLFSTDPRSLLCMRVFRHGSKRPR